MIHASERNGNLMKKTMKLIAVILAVIVMVSALPLTVIAEDYDIAPMSLLPLDYYRGNVTIDRREEIPPEFMDGSPFAFYTYEALSEILYQNGFITAPDAEYSGKIFYALEENGSFKEVGWSEAITVRYNYDYVYFLLSDGDQLNPDNVRIRMYVRFSEDSIQNYLDADIVNIYKDGEKVYAPSCSWFSTTGGVGSGYRQYYRLNVYASGKYVANDDQLSFMLSFPEDYPAESVTIYKGMYFTQEELEASNPEDITLAVIEGGENAAPISLTKVNPGYYSSYWASEITVYVKAKNGKTFIIPTSVQFSTRDNYISYYLSNYSSSSAWQYLDLYNENGTWFGYIDVTTEDSLKDAKWRYYNGHYVDLVDQSLENYQYGNIDNILAMYVGEYSSLEEAQAAGAEDVKESFFSNDGYYVPISLAKERLIVYTEDGKRVSVRYLSFTAFDSYGYVIPVGGSTFGVLLDPLDEPEESEPTPSTSTSFSISSAEAVDGDSSKYLSYWKVPSEYDSYYRNGYQTVFLLDRNGGPVDAEQIIPYFSTGKNVKVYIGADMAEEGSTTTEQISGESRINFESGKAIQYAAIAENEEIPPQNYWVTFVTQEKGPKLFVNATNNPDHYNSETNNPRRELFLNNRSGNYHDIFFANIGDETLTGIDVKLSDDAEGVALDEYWTVIDESVRTLAAFDSTSNNKRYNIAKIRLNQVDDSFRAISGTLTISADGDDPVNIELTGIAGLPKIVSDGMLDGVKYVPYSCLVMTNSMYQSDELEYTITDGELPMGMELKPNGEIYGIPKKAGEYTFTVTITFKNDSTYTDSKELTIVIADNTDENVDAVNYDEQGYELMDRVSREVTIVYSELDSDGNPIIEEIIADSDVFRSEGSYEEEFLNFYINGNKLEKDVDYIAEEGSTKITILAEAFSHIGLADEGIAHTLAAEFRTSGDELKRSAQNVYLKYIEHKEEEEPDSGSTNPGTAGPSTPSNPGEAGPSAPSNPDLQYPNVPETYLSVNAVMVIVDPDGNPLTGLSLELHSDVKYAITDVNGLASFNDVEFGRHTLYLTDSTTNTTVSKVFTIVSGFEAGLTGDIITAEVGETIYITAVYDGTSLAINSATIEVDPPQEGTTTDEDEEDIDATTEVVDVEETDSDEESYDSDSNPGTGMVLAFPALLSAMIVTVVAKKKQW